ncbi:MAG: hypothetical protein GY845_13470 [Planctomycetes bacterium]|nr:hypothetical protein [Planctomycetota bacterium]
MIVITKNNNSMCQEAKPYYYDCLSEQSCGPIPLSISSHIDQCPHCQKEINQLKAVLSQKECINPEQGQDSSAVTTMLQLHFAYIGKYVTCETVRPFLPGMLDPAIEIRIPTPITAHLDNCPKCAEDLKEIQKLNLNSTKLYQLSQFFVKGHSPDTSECSKMAASVTAIAERPDSEVVTIYHVDESAKARQASESDDLYAGFPIRVEIIKQKVDVEQSAPTINFAAALKEKISAINLKPFLKIALPAAAVILISFMLLHNTTSVKAVTLEQISKAIELVKNVHISKSKPDETGLLTKITEERWVSRTLDISMSKTERGFVLWDISNRLIQSKHSETGEIETNKLLDDNIPTIKQQISGSLGLMPLNIPPGSKLLRVRDDIPGVAEGIEIYELKLDKRKYRSSSEFIKWRFFVDPNKNLPQKIETYRKSTADGEYNLITMIEVKDLSESEIRKVFKEAGF